MPYEALREATKQGYANTLVGTDGYVRRAMAYIDDEEGQRSYSLASQAYKTYQEGRGASAEWPKVDENNQYLFSYSGKTGCYSTISMTDVMDGTVNPAVFADGIVFVGAYAAGMQDSYMPAISHGTQMYGVEIQANIVEALLEKKTQQQMPTGIFGSACSGVLPCDTADEDYSCDNPDVGGCGGSRARFCNADVYARDCNTCYFTSRCVFRDICGTFDLRICAGNYAAAEGCKRV